MKNFINRPIPRLLRYELLLRSIMQETPPGHEDLDSIPNVIDVIKALGKETEPGVFSAKQKVEVWRYNAGLVFKPGESIVRGLRLRMLIGANAPFFDRTWISLMISGHLFIREDCSGNLIVVSNGMVGVNFMSFSSTIIVSKAYF
jgi:hypothetical protein